MEQENEKSSIGFGSFWHMSGITQDKNYSKEFLMEKILERAKEIRDIHTDIQQQENKPFKK